jgi:hypothetical protein
MARLPIGRLVHAIFTFTRAFGRAPRVIPQPAVEVGRRSHPILDGDVACHLGAQLVVLLICDLGKAVMVSLTAEPRYDGDGAVVEQLAKDFVRGALDVHLHDDVIVSREVLDEPAAEVDRGHAVGLGVVDCRPAPILVLLLAVNDGRRGCTTRSEEVDGPVMHPCRAPDDVDVSAQLEADVRDHGQQGLVRLERVTRVAGVLPHEIADRSADIGAEVHVNATHNSKYPISRGRPVTISP